LCEVLPATGKGLHPRLELGNVVMGEEEKGRGRERERERGREREREGGVEVGD
jgi:hypothetical protein